jgi:hypothetical protein
MAVVMAVMVVLVHHMVDAEAPADILATAALVRLLEVITVLLVLAVAEAVVLQTVPVLLVMEVALEYLAKDLMVQAVYLVLILLLSI